MNFENAHIFKLVVLHLFGLGNYWVWLHLFLLFLPHFLLWFPSAQIRWLTVNRGCVCLYTNMLPHKFDLKKKKERKKVHKWFKRNWIAHSEEDLELTDSCFTTQKKKEVLGMKWILNQLSISKKIKYSTRHNKWFHITTSLLKYITQEVITKNSRMTIWHFHWWAGHTGIRTDDGGFIYEAAKMKHINSVIALLKILVFIMPRYVRLMKCMGGCV